LTAGASDTPAVKTIEAGGPCGYDAAKKVTGRNRHLLVGIWGLLIACVVPLADLQD
jgi:hypothetical protein